MKTELIRKLHLKKGSKYIIFFPKSTGLTAREIAEIEAPELEGVQFLLESTRGIKVIEKEDKEL